MWKNVVEQGRPQMTIWCMHIPKTTQTVRICNTFCFSTATMVARTCLNVTLYIHCLTCSVFLDQFGYPLLYFPIDDVLTSCPCCQYFYCFQYIFHSYPTHHPSGDGPSGWTQQGCHYCHHFSSITTLIHHFPPYIQSTQVYSEMSLCTPWVGPEYSLKKQGSKKLVEQEI